MDKGKAASQFPIGVGQTPMVKPLRETTKLKWNMLLQPQAATTVKLTTAGAPQQPHPVAASALLTAVPAPPGPGMDQAEGVTAVAAAGPMHLVKALEPDLSSSDASSSNPSPPLGTASEISDEIRAAEASFSEPTTAAMGMESLRSSLGFDWKVVGNPKSATVTPAIDDQLAAPSQSVPYPGHSRERALSLLERTSGACLLSNPSELFKPAPMTAHPARRSVFSPFDSAAASALDDVISESRDSTSHAVEDDALQGTLRRASLGYMSAMSAKVGEFRSSSPSTVTRATASVFAPTVDQRRQSLLEPPVGSDDPAGGWRSTDMSPVYHRERMQPPAARATGRMGAYQSPPEFGAAAAAHRASRQSPMSSLSHHLPASPLLSTAPYSVYPGRRSSAPLRHPFSDSTLSMGLEDEMHGMSLHGPAHAQQDFYEAAPGAYYPPYPPYAYSQHQMMYHQAHGFHHQQLHPAMHYPANLPHFMTPHHPRVSMSGSPSNSGMYEQFYAADYDEGMAGPYGASVYSGGASSSSSLESAIFQLSSYRGPLYVVEFKAGRAEVFYILEGPDGKPLFRVAAGDLVIVEADRGEDLGKVTTTIGVDRLRQVMSMSGANGEDAEAAASSVEPELAPLLYAKEIVPKRIHRPAGPADLNLLQAKAQEEAIAMVRCQSRVRQKRLPMEVVDAEYQWDRNKLTFYFQADRRIDFRELVRDLFRIYKTRIWMCAVDSNRLARIAEMQRLEPPLEIPDDVLVIYDDFPATSDEAA